MITAIHLFVALQLFDFPFLQLIAKRYIGQAPKSIALGFAPCLLESTRTVAVMEIMPNKQIKFRSEARQRLQHLCTEFSGIPF